MFYKTENRKLNYCPPVWVSVLKILINTILFKLHIKKYSYSEAIDDDINIEIYPFQLPCCYSMDTDNIPQDKEFL